MNLQQHHDLEVSKDLFEKQIKKEIHPLSTSQLKINGRTRKHA